MAECPDWRDKTVEESEKQKAENKAKKEKAEKQKADDAAKNARAAIDAAIACGEVIPTNGVLPLSKATPIDLIRAFDDIADSGFDGFPFDAFTALAKRVEAARVEMEKRAKALQEAKAQEAMRAAEYADFRASLESPPTAFEMAEKRKEAKAKDRKAAEMATMHAEITLAQTANHAQHVADYHAQAKKQKAANARKARAAKAVAA